MVAESLPHTEEEGRWKPVNSIFRWQIKGLKMIDMFQQVGVRNSDGPETLPS